MLFSIAVNRHAGQINPKYYTTGEYRFISRLNLAQKSTLTKSCCVIIYIYSLHLYLYVLI